MYDKESQQQWEKDCPKCGSETVVNEKRRKCEQYPTRCNYYMRKGGEFTKPRNVEPGWWSALGDPEA